MQIMDLLLQIYENYQDLIFTSIVPFLIILAIFYGTLEATKLFNKKVRVLLAIAFTIAVFASPIYPIISTYFINLSGFTVIIVFGGIFILGLIFWAFGRVQETYWGTAGYETKIHKLEKKIDKLMEKAHGATDAESARIAQEVKDLQTQIEFYKRQQQSKGYF